jgi:hypothetical protein
LEEISNDVHEADFWPRIKVARITESVSARYGALRATAPMLATVSPFFIEGSLRTPSSKRVMQPHLHESLRLSKPGP